MKQLTNNDILLVDNRFLVLGLAPEDRPDELVAVGAVDGVLHSLKDLKDVVARFSSPDSGGDPILRSMTFLLDEEKAMGVLRDNPALGAYLLSQVPAGGRLLWSGGGSERRLSGGGSVGVKVRNGEYEGDNLFGDFLTRVASRYRDYLQNNDIEPLPPRDGRVIANNVFKSPVFSGKSEEDYFMKYSGEVLSDFIKDRNSSEIAVREAEGERFIHVDNYRAEWWRSNTAKNGTTGYTERDIDPEVSFHKFECPFGTSFPAPIIVGSSAEQSYLYEMALLGRLDWDALVDDLVERGLMRPVNDREKDTLVKGYVQQFNWMREQISSDPDLADIPIVAQSLVPADASMGASVYDAQNAPSPAHLLSRYIDNPELLYASAEPFTIQALRHAGENEFKQVSVALEAESVCAVVFGSDTVGGRVPGGKATSTYKNVKTFDQKGRPVWKREKKFEIPLKPEDERKEDVANVHSRLDELFAGVPEKTSVILVTGGSSATGDSIGVGLPNVVRDYVLSKNDENHPKAAVVASYDFLHKRLYTTVKDDKGRMKEVALNALDYMPKYVCVMMEHFTDVFPALVRDGVSSGFKVDNLGKDVPVIFNASQAGISADMAISFLDSRDVMNRNVAALSSMALDTGYIPLFQNVDNQPQSEIAIAYLREKAASSLSKLTGATIEFEPMLYAQREQEWNGNTVLRYPAEGTLSVLSRFVDNPVTVEGIPFRDVVSLGIAFMAAELYPGDRERLRAVQAAEGDAAALSRIFNALDAEGGLSAEDKERCLRRAVREFSAVSPDFLRLLVSVEDTPAVVGADAGLFVDGQMKGFNYLGVILGSEAAYARDLKEDNVRKEVASQRMLVQEAQMKRSLIARSVPDGDKVMSGIPATVEGLGQEAWIIGCARPINLMIPNNGISFFTYDDDHGKSYFCRERAKRDFIDLGNGIHIPNNYLYMYATDLAAELGKRRINGLPDSRDMKGVTRKGPDGVPYLCTVGIPVMKNIQRMELNNPDGMPTSFFRDKDIKEFLSGLYAADSSARILSEKHNLVRTLSARVSKTGEEFYPLGNEFKSRIYNPASRKPVDNLHAAPALLEAVEWYISTLKEGRFYPHNVFVLPREEYEDTDEGRRQFRSDFRKLLDMASFYAVSKGVKVRFPYDAEGHLMLGEGVPVSCRDVAEKMVDSFLHVVKPGPAEGERLPELRVVPFGEPEKNGAKMEIMGSVFEPLRANDLARAFGPFDFSELSVKNNSPAHEITFRMEDGTYVRIYDMRLVASPTKEIVEYGESGQYPYGIKMSDPDEAKLDGFLMSLRGYIDRAREMKTDIKLVLGTDAEADGFSLEGFVSLFGQGDKSSQKDIDNFFRTFEGDINLKVSENDKKKGEKQKVGKTLSAEQCSVLIRSLLYSGEPVRLDKGERSFSFETSFTPKKVPEELMTLLSSESYIPTKRIEVSLSVVPSEEIDMIGFVNLLESNTENRFTSDKHDVGQELNIYNIGSRFDESNDKTPYYGREDAKDGFAGYAMLKYTLPDGTESDWHRVTDLDLAKQIVMSLVGRKYSFDGVAPYTGRQLDMFCTAEAVKMAGEDFLYCQPLRPKQSVADDKVVYLENGSYDLGGGKDEGVEEAKEPKRVSILNSPGSESAPQESAAPAETQTQPEGKSVQVSPKEPEKIDYPKLITIDRSVESGIGYIRENCEAEDVDFTFAVSGSIADGRFASARESAGTSYLEFDVDGISAGNADKLAKYIKEQLPGDCFKGEPFSINFVCEDGYSSFNRGLFSTQKDADVFFASFFMALKELGAVVSSVRSGGLPGLEEAAVSGAVANGIEAHVHASSDCSTRHLFTGKESSGDLMAKEAAFRRRFNLKDFAGLYQTASKKRSGMSKK